MALKKIEGRYQVLKRLASTGMGEVYKVKDLTSDSVLALKLSPKDSTEDDLIRFKREFYTLSRLCHQNIIEVRDFGVLAEEKASAGVPTWSRCYFTMEFIEGEDVLRRFQKKHPFSKRTYQRLYSALSQLCHALFYIHSKGLVHCDLKPANVLISKSDSGTSDRSDGPGRSLTVKLLDFGLAGEVTPSSSALAAGTLGYIAPEVLRGGKADPRSDLYSLGVILWEILSKTRAFPGDNPVSIVRDNLTKKLLPPTQCDPTVPEALEKIVLKLVGKEPRERYSSALEVLEELSSMAPQVSLGELPSQAPYLLTSSLVGRDDVLRSFESLLDKAKTGAGQVMVLRGDRGIGKSSLLQQFKFQAQLGGSWVVSGSCCQSEKAPLSPWRQMLLQLQKRDGKEIPPLAGEVPSPQDRAGVKKLQLFESVASRIVEFSRGQREPLVVLIDDLDLADSNSLELYSYLSRSLDKSKVLLAAFCEKSAILADLLGELGELPFAVSIELKELRLQEVHLMLLNILGGKTTPPRLDQWVYQQAGGNPLLIEETMSAVVKDNILRREGLQWRFHPEDLKRVKPSKDIRGLVESWLERLNKREAGLLVLASVLGDGFDLGILEEMSGLEAGPFFRAFNSLEAENLVTRERGADFVFSHKWAQRVLYDRVPGSKRKRLHRKAARTIEKRFPDRWFELAHHYLNGEIRSKAYEYSLLAGDRSRQSLANEEALQYYQNALKLSRELKRLGERPEISEKAGDVCNLLGRYDEGLEAYTSARSMLASQARADSLAQATLLRKISTIHHKRGDYGKALESLQEAEELAREAPMSEEMARILNETGWVRQLKGEHDRAADSYSQALRIAEQRKDLAMLSRTYYNLGVLFWSQKDLTKAVEYCKKALSIDRRTKDPYGMASSYTLLGAIYLALGNSDRAIRSHRETLKLSKETSDVYSQLTSLINLGILSRRKGMLDEAEDYISQAVPLAEKIGDLKIRGRVHNNLGLLYQQNGEWDKALQHYRRSLKVHRKSNDRLLEAGCYDNLGSLELNRGNLEAAYTKLYKGLKMHQNLKDEPGLGFSYLYVGQLLAEKDQWEEALANYKKSIAIYEAEGDDYNLAEAYGAMADACLSLGDREGALTYCNRSLELSEKAGNPFARGSAYRTLASAYLETDDRDKVAEYLSRSTEVFRAVGAKFELGKSLLEAGTLALKMMEDEETQEWLSSARSNLKEAQLIFRDLGAKAYLERANSGLDALVDTVLSGRFDFARRGEYFQILYRISELVNSISSQDELLNQVLDLAINLVGGERGLLLLIDEETGDFFVASGPDVDKATVSDATRISRTILDEVVEGGKPVISNDALRDPLFKESNSVVLNKIRSLLCVPLMAKGETIGTIYVDSRVEANIFSRMDEEFLLAVANLIGATIDQSRFSIRLQRENVVLKDRLHQRRGLRDMIGDSEEMLRIYQAVEKVAATDSTVLIQGETGTGKELLARAIHHLGKRSPQKFLTIDCSALMETLLESELFGHRKGSFTGAIEDKAGLFEEAHKGTLFLDEIGDASLAVQAKLLRAIERGEMRRVGETRWRKVDVRVICATNKDLEQEVKTGRFREDLFYRLNTFTLKVPPLRDRTGDVYLLANHFLKRYRAQFKKKVSGFTSDALNYLTNHPWPGNVRQLEKAIERAVIMCEAPRVRLIDISPKHAETALRAVPLREAKTQAEAQRVRRALVGSKGNVSRAAKELGITRRQLHRLMAKYGIERNSLPEIPSG